MVEHSGKDGHTSEEKPGSKGGRFSVCTELPGLKFCVLFVLQCVGRASINSAQAWILSDVKHSETSHWQ